MEGWADLAMPWWQMAARAAISYIGLLVLMRISGKHAFAELSPFEILVLIIVAGTLRTAIVGDDHSLLGPFIAITTIIALDKLLAVLCARSAAFERLVAGRAVVLARNGRVDYRALEQNAISPEEFERAMREHSIASASAIRVAVLEPDGKISFLTRRD